MGVLGIIWLLCFVFPSVYHQVNGVSYDYGFTSECLASPLKAQYGGGIVVNPEFNDGLNGWSNFGDAKLARSVTKDSDNKFAVVYNRRNGSSLSQKFSFQKGMFYTISAWFRVSRGKSPVTIALRMSSDSIAPIGNGFARSECWSMLKSGFTANISGDGEIYFQTQNATANYLWADSVSVQPFTEEEWKSHQIQSVEKVRKSKIIFQVVDPHGRPLPGVKISVNHLSNGFPLGNAITKDILTNTAYQNYFTSRFKLTVFGDEMKWYTTENTRGTEDYSQADAMLNFCQNHGITVRGHNIFWDDPKYQPWWVKTLSPTDLKTAADKRIQSVVQRYKGKVIHWDVVNENLHFNFFESKLGASASAGYYKWAGELDPSATPFLNDYNTIEYQSDSSSSPAKYLEKIKEMQVGGVRSLGIGLEGHFGKPDIAYIRSALDTLASTKLPIWITELDVGSDPDQAHYLDQVIRELHAHPTVNAIVLWGAWSSTKGCWRMCLTDSNFKNLPTGDVVDKILGEWRPENALIGSTDENGYLETSLFHGHYEATINDGEDWIMSSSNYSSIPPITFKVDPNPKTTQNHVLITHK